MSADNFVIQASDEGLVRALGLGSAVLFVLGSVIGSGIFLTTGVMAAALPSPSLLLAAWVAGGVIALTRRPDLRRDGRDVSPVRRGLRLPARGVRAADRVPLRLGGAARLLQRRHRRGRGRLRRLRQLLRAGAVDVARPLVGATPSGRGRCRRRRSSRSSSIAALGAINYVGVRSGNRVNIVLTIAKVAGLAALPILALVASRVTRRGRRSCRRIWRGRWRGSASR